MPIYDYQCQKCQAIEEVFTLMNYRPAEVKCQVCGGKATQIITMREASAPVDPGWIRSVTEVVDKDLEAPAHCKEFLRHPTRANYKAWMDGEGLRPMDPAEKPHRKPTEKEETARKDRVKDRLCREMMKDERVEVGG
ncbi:MAG: zinc ribbon domain-containing protein [Desulfobacterium sp.]|nr:zinc ribbon domain-containing protein [Desulfobacterium sp.]